MRASLADIAADLAEASLLLVQRIRKTLNEVPDKDDDNVVTEGNLYAAAVLIWSLQRPGSAVRTGDVAEVLVHWFAAFAPRYNTERELFFKAADHRAAQYIVLWERGPDAAAFNTAQFFREVVACDIPDAQTAALAEVLNTARYAIDAFIQAVFATG